MVAIIFIGDLKYCPYLNIYEDILNELGMEYDFLFWNRTEGNLAKLPYNYIPYRKSSKLKKNKLLKLKDFEEYRLWLKEKLQEKKYNALILLSTLSGIILTDVILKYYKNRYIFDIRDYSYEKIYPFYKVEEILLKCSMLNCISSKGFLNFLPKTVAYLSIHNIAGFDYNRQYYFVKKKYGDTLNIVWNGVTRYFRQQKQIIDQLGNDNRFNLYYYGTGAEYDDYIAFVQKRAYSNVFIMGAYDNNEKTSILENADIINNSYQYSMETKYLMPNRFYDGIFFKIPQLVETVTYKCMEVERQRLGIGLDVYEHDFANQLYNYYHSIDESDFNSQCEKTLVSVLTENKVFANQIKRHLLLNEN